MNIAGMLLTSRDRYKQWVQGEKDNINHQLLSSTSISMSEYWEIIAGALACCGA
jgi:hypothetical protein